MSDGKEVKTWDVRGVMVEPSDFMGEYVLASDHARIVAELRAELFAANHKLDKHRAANKMLETTIARQARELEQWKDRYQRLKKVYSPDEDDFALRAIERAEGEKE